jgi:hypothetical protein
MNDHDARIAAELAQFRDYLTELRAGTDPNTDPAQRPAVPTVAPSRDDTVTIPTNRPTCGAPFHRVGRQRYCSPACRQRAYRARRHHTPPIEPITLPAGHRPRRDTTIYACPDCEQRFHARQWCPDCNRPCRRIGPGGPCPHCPRRPLTPAPLTGPTLETSEQHQHRPAIAHGSPGGAKSQENQPRPLTTAGATSKENSGASSD